MAKKSDVTLVWPPRYRRNDPRNQARVKAGHLLSMRLAGYDYPIRKLCRVGDCCCVTLPLQVRNLLDVKRGEWLVFGVTPWPGVVSVLKISDEQYRLKRAEDRKGALLRARKVQGGNGSLFVNISPTVRKILSVEVGDFLMFGIAPGQDMVTVSAIKGDGESPCSRRTG
jgi:hypothetical protein